MVHSMSGPQIPGKSKFVPHKTLQEGWTYVSVPGDNVVVGVKVLVTKMMKLYNADGTPQRDAAGNPGYWFQSTNAVRVLTQDEYKAIKDEGITE